jgi:hypothetical protein
MSSQPNVIAQGHGADPDHPCMSGHDFQQVGGMSGSGSMLVMFCRKCGEVRRVPVA